MDFTHLRSLLAVSERGAIGGAAERLGISQPALTRRIRLLEEEFGADLVERSGRGIALTETGRLVVGEGRVLVERYDRLKEEVQRRVRLEAGVVRVGGGATAVSYVLPKAIGDFHRTFPDVRFDVREAGSRDVEEAVRQESLELGLVTLPTASKDPADLTVSPLFTDQIVLVAGKRHPLANEKRVVASELQGLSLVGFEAGTAIRELIDTALRAAGVTVEVVMELRSIAAILKMVESTSSLAFVSELGAPKGRTIEVGDLKVERQLALISKKGRPLSPAAAAFAEAIIAQN
ncbi:LysR substrate-binding domain-containing protein [Myxococcota bacterium]|nr:LysR substrate-binding domain-containing protein [Myxococcota bacterium]